MEGRDHLTRHEPCLGRAFVHDSEPPLDLVRRVDDRGHDRHAAADVEEPIAVRRVIAAEAPDTAEARGPARAFLSQAPDQLDGERVSTVARLLAGVDRQLLPDAEAVLVPLRKVPRPRQQASVALAHANPFERDDRIREEAPESGQHAGNHLARSDADDGRRNGLVRREEPGALAAPMHEPVDP